MSQSRPEVTRLGYFGSYARDEWGVGSDLDLVAIVAAADEAFERRGAGWDTMGLPVPAEILVYTESEWDTLQTSGSRFAQSLLQEVVWVLPPLSSKRGE